jgi:hypothetical protein
MLPNYPAESLTEKIPGGAQCGDNGAFETSFGIIFPGSQFSIAEKRHIGLYFRINPAFLVNSRGVSYAFFG